RRGFGARARPGGGDGAAAAARFNTLQNLPANAEVPPVPLSSVDRSLPEATALRAAIEKSPAILQAQAEVRRAERDLDRARLDRRPDLKFMTSYGEREQPDAKGGAT